MSAPVSYGAAADFYGDHGESVNYQPGIRRSIALEKMADLSHPEPPSKTRQSAKVDIMRTNRAAGGTSARRLTKSELSQLEHQPTKTAPSSIEWHNDRTRINAASPPPPPRAGPQQRKKDRYQPHVSDFFDNA